MEIYDLKARIKRLNASIKFLEKEVSDVLTDVLIDAESRNSWINLESYDTAKAFDKAVIQGNKKAVRLHDAIVLMSQERSELGKRIQRLRQAEYEERRHYERMVAMQKAKEELERAALINKKGWIIINGKNV